MLPTTTRRSCPAAVALMLVAASAAAAPKLVMVPVTVGTPASPPVELMDALARGLQANPSWEIARDSTPLVFASDTERRQTEDKRVVQRAAAAGADVVVLVSINDLVGNDWLNGRLYLRSGYLNRQGFIRLEAARAEALGKYLSTGKGAGAVLSDEEAQAMVAAAAGPDPAAPPDRSPWYTDVPGWCLTGGGLVLFGVGRWFNAKAEAKGREADMDRTSSFHQDELYRDAESLNFWARLGTMGGGLVTLTGLVLLAVPNYKSQRNEMIVLHPTHGGGASLSWCGRF